MYEFIAVSTEFMLWCVLKRWLCQPPVKSIREQKPLGYVCTLVRLRVMQQTCSSFKLKSRTESKTSLAFHPVPMHFTLNGFFPCLGCSAFQAGLWHCCFLLEGPIFWCFEARFIIFPCRKLCLLKIIPCLWIYGYCSFKGAVLSPGALG